MNLSQLQLPWMTFYYIIVLHRVVISLHFLYPVSVVVITPNSVPVKCVVVLFFVFYVTIKHALLHYLHHHPTLRWALLWVNHVFLKLCTIPKMCVAFPKDAIIHPLYNGSYIHIGILIIWLQVFGWCCTQSYFLAH